MSVFRIIPVVAAGLFALVMAPSVSAQLSSEDRLGKKAVRGLLASASTPVDHEKLARHFQAEAAALDEDAVRYEELLAAHRTFSPSTKPTAAIHWNQQWRFLAESRRKAAAESRKLADGHTKVAQEMMRKPGSKIVPATPQ